MENQNLSTKIDYKTELIDKGVLAFVPKGNSMWPTLKNRGQSVIVKLKQEKLNRYDVALYQRNNNVFVLHRVMEQTDDGYIICGDSQFVLEKVKEEQVFGIMVGFYRGKKYVDCNDQKYIKKIVKWFKNKRRRKIKLSLFFFKEKVKCKIKSVLRKIFGRKNKNV